MAAGLVGGDGLVDHEHHGTALAADVLFVNEPVADVEVAEVGAGGAVWGGDEVYVPPPPRGKPLLFILGGRGVFWVEADNKTIH